MPHMKPQIIKLKQQNALHNFKANPSLLDIVYKTTTDLWGKTI